MAYGILAQYYDGLMAHVDYEAWADYMLGFVQPGLEVLDLGCGTGRFTEILQRRGYDVVAVDGSEAMLSVAAARDCGALLLCQRMQRLDLYGTVQAAFCTLDGVNYLTRRTDLAACLSRVALFLEPGGLFVFDVHASAALAGRDGRSFVSESDEAFCVWQCAYDAPLCRQQVDLFVRDGAVWRRHRELHTERAYGEDELRDALTAAGFDRVDCYGMFTREPPTGESERLLFVARRGV